MSLLNRKIDNKGVLFFYCCGNDLCIAAVNNLSDCSILKFISHKSCTTHDICIRIENGIALIVIIHRNLNRYTQLFCKI